MSHMIDETEPSNEMIATMIRRRMAGASEEKILGAIAAQFGPRRPVNPLKFKSAMMHRNRDLRSVAE